MLFVAYYCAFYSLKQAVHILYNYSGSLNIWLIVGYLIITAFILRLPFKPMLKALWPTLMTLDALAPITGDMAMRWFGFALSTAWLVWYVSHRFVKTGDLEIHPWRTDSKNRENPDSR